MDIKSLFLKAFFILVFCSFIANTAMSNDFEKCLTISGENGKGSGFFVKIDDQIYIATNNHVLMGIEEPQMYCNNRFAHEVKKGLHNRLSAA